MWRLRKLNLEKQADVIAKVRKREWLRESTYKGLLISTIVAVSGCSYGTPTEETTRISPMSLVFPALILLALLGIVLIGGAFTFFVARHSRWLAEPEENGKSEKLDLQ